MENDKSKWAPQRRHLMLAGALCISMMLPPTTAFAEITPHVSNSQAVAQTTRTVTGTVIDKTTGEAIIGATITVKGTNIKAVTDLDGKFSIKLTGKKQNVLEVSYIGFRTEEVDVEGQATIEIKIEPGDESLQEVVVVGAGTQKKIAMTGAITTIKGSDLRAPSSSLTTNLAGKFAGIIATTGSGEPGTASSFYIRGVGTFGGRATPLILLDDVEISSGDLNNVPAETIKSFTLLKDASATAVYGVRGANGVMLITTKEGAENQKARVNVTLETTYQHPTKHVKFADGATWMETYNEALKARTASATDRYTADQITNTRNHVNPYLYPDVDWYDVLFKSGNWNQRGNISVSGGGTRATYYMSLQVNHDTGIINAPSNYAYNNNINRMSYNFQNNIGYKLTRTTKLDLRMNAQIRKKTGPTNSTQDIFSQLYNENPIMFPATYPTPEGGNHIYFGNAILTGDALRTNPLAYMLSGYNEYNENKLNISLNVKQDLDMVTKGLNFSALVNWNNWSASSYYKTINPYYYRVTDGSWTPDDMTTYQLEQLGRPGTDFVNTSALSRDADQTFYFDARLNYGRTFGKHTVGGMLMYMMREYRKTQLPNRNQGLSGRFTYDFDNRYWAEFNFGYNGTERLAKGHRFEFFPAMSLGWVPSQEAFWEPLRNTIDYMKIRGSYGLVGSDETGTSAGAPHFLYFDTITLHGGGSYTTGPSQTLKWGKNGPAVDGFAVMNATWERVKKLDIGVDISLWHQLNVTFDYFHDHRYNILLKRAAWPYQMGYFNGVPWSNIGQADNWGYELSVNWKKQVNKDLYVDLRGNFTYTQNKYKYLDEPNYPYVWQTSTEKPISRTTGYIAEGLFQSQEEIDNSPRQDLGSTVMPGDIKYRDVNGDGVVNSEDQVMISPYGSTPRIQYGLGLNVTWKKLDVGVFFNGSAKRTLMLSGIRPFGQNNNNLMKFIADDHWSVDNPNPNAAYPRLGLNDQLVSNNTVSSTYWMRNGNFIRFKTLEIGYTFPHCRAYFSADNLAVWSPFKHWDPELWWNKYPFSRSFNLGLQINI